MSSNTKDRKPNHNNDKTKLDIELVPSSKVKNEGITTNETTQNVYAQIHTSTKHKHEDLKEEVTDTNVAASEVPVMVNIEENDSSEEQEEKYCSLLMDDIYTKLELNDDNINEIKTFMETNKYNEDINLFDFDYKKILLDLEQHLKNKPDENKLYQKIEKINRAIRYLNALLWQAWCNVNASCITPKNKENIEHICFEKWVKWTEKEWESQVDNCHRGYGGELAELLTSYTNVLEFISYVLFRLGRISSGGWDYIKLDVDHRERKKLIINNTQTNPNYIKLATGKKYDFTIKIKADNESELDIDIGWVLISKSENNEYKIEKEWTWNGLTGIKKINQQEKK
eukprot:482227_1